MAAYTGDVAGLVTSWAGSGNSTLIATSNAPMEFALTYRAPDVQTTPLSTGIIANTAIPNIRDWEVAIKGRLNPAKLGNTGIVTFTGGYVLNVKDWKVDLAWEPQKATSMSASAVTANSFIPGILTWGGNFTGFADTGTGIEPPGEDAATLTLVLANLATDLQLSGSAFTTQVQSTVAPGKIVEYAYDFRGTGDLTSQAGSSPYSTFLWSDGAIPKPTAGSLVLTSYTGRTYTGDAFMKSMSITVTLENIIMIDIVAQGSGALTIA
ncbi:MAG: hypothetical protein E6R03_03820 [Hyphomicrobiaceae bacterium]|nr:MAG: hypothetical protein E6R03_03820 [Hyphomicrobiaceae bacterium]